MTRFLLKSLLVPALLSMAIAAGALAQSSDGRLVGTWHGQAGEEKLVITFNADGSTIMGNEKESRKGHFTADFSKAPGTLTLSADGREEKVMSWIEFVDDNHVKISEPRPELPASMAEGGPVVFERAAK